MLVNALETIKEEKLFKKGNYSREEIIHRNSVCGATNRIQPFPCTSVLLRSGTNSTSQSFWQKELRGQLVSSLKSTSVQYFFPEYSNNTLLASHFKKLEIYIALFISLDF